MPTIDELREAYRILELEVGASLERVHAQYRLLAQVWHPDNAPTAIKEQAAEKMKKINAAKDILEKHFKSGKQRGNPYNKSESAANSRNANNNYLKEWHFDGAKSISPENLLEELSQPQLQHVRRLRISFYRGYNTHILEAVSKLKHLEHLDIFGCYNITDSLLLGLIGCSSLKTLCIRDTGITKDNAKAFAKIRPDCKVRYRKWFGGIAFFIRHAQLGRLSEVLRISCP